MVPERKGRTDRQTDRFAISISCASMLTRDKKKLLKITIPLFVTTELNTKVGTGTGVRCEPGL